MLPLHPTISALPVEGVVLADSIPRPEKFGWSRMWSECIDQVRMLPGEHLRAITDFLDIEPLPEDTADRSWEIHRRTSTIRNMNARGVAKLSADDVERIRGVAGATLDKYGYEPG